MLRVAEKEVPFHDFPPELVHAAESSSKSRQGKRLGWPIVFNQPNLVAQCANEDGHDQVQFLTPDSVWSSTSGGRPGNRAAELGEGGCVRASLPPAWNSVERVLLLQPQANCRKQPPSSATGVELQVHVQRLVLASPQRNVVKITAQKTLRLGPVIHSTKLISRPHPSRPPSVRHSGSSPLRNARPVRITGCGWFIQSNSNPLRRDCPQEARQS
jgi:hypothetical protein